MNDHGGGEVLAAVLRELRGMSDGQLLLMLGTITGALAARLGADHTRKLLEVAGQEITEIAAGARP